MKISKERAKKILFEEAELAERGDIDPVWQKRFQDFSEICERTSKTHIAFLGTALLAKSVDTKVDAFSVKAGDTHPGAYSARGLGHGVLVPNAPRLNINLGVSGREPLNNQPYFRIMRISRDIPVHGNAKRAIDSLCTLLEKIDGIKNPNEARHALRAFIYIRRQYHPIYVELDTDSSFRLSRHELTLRITQFISQSSEGGKRAQAVAAGILDIFATPERVVTGRINDPDRHLPGDVGIRNLNNEIAWEKVFEVRDKPVTVEDVFLFITKAIENHLDDVALIAIAKHQVKFDTNELIAWLNTKVIACRLFFSWENFIEEVIFWSAKPEATCITVIPKYIYNRAIELEVSPEGVATLVSLFEMER